jgi:hypothetical protein
LQPPAEIEEDERMGAATRSLAIAALGLALLPAAALGASVNRDTQTGVLTIVDPDGNSRRRQHRRRARGRATRPGPRRRADERQRDCSTARPINCPLSTSVAVNLGGGNDSFGAIAMPVPISVAGGPGNDDIAPATARTCSPAARATTPCRQLGVDDYFGEAGNDTITRTTARRADLVRRRHRRAHNDFVDIIAECERGVDVDRDGFSSAVDCNDGAANIFPGAPEVFDNGVDENCDGRDNPNLDRDRDGFPSPPTATTATRKIHPGALEIRGNRWTRTATAARQPFAQLGAVVSNQWVVTAGFARLLRLVVHNAPKGARIALTCKGRGCPSRKTTRRTVTRELQRIDLHRAFRRARCGFGTRLTAPHHGAADDRAHLHVRGQARPAPRRTTVCRAPGRSKGRSC